VLHYERFNYDVRGHIVSLSTNENKENVLIWDESHVSFPTAHNSGIMVESSSSNCIKFFDRYGRFTGKLELSESSYLDPVVFKNDDCQFLFASRHGKLRHSDLYLYYRSEGRWKLVTQNPICCSQIGGRMAGSILNDEKLGLLRFGQISTPRYGSAIAVYSIKKLSRFEYSEELLGEIHAPKGYLGIHTINTFENGFVVDLMNIRNFSFKKIIQRLNAKRRI